VASNLSCCSIKRASIIEPLLGADVGGRGGGSTAKARRARTRRRSRHSISSRHALAAARTRHQERLRSIHLALIAFLMATLDS
jgi:hypothetical protein